MSNAGQAVLSVVGAVVGFFIGGPTGAIYGFQLGYLAGTALFPTQLPAVQGPRLGEGEQTQSVVGAPIPIVFGTQRVGGIVIFASPIREVSTSEDLGGKGGPEQSQTTYSYFRSFAVLLCEGPIAGVRRIWFNGKLVYDRSVPIDPIDFEDPDTYVDRVQRGLALMAASDGIGAKMTLYLGTEDQMPDPTIESFVGVGNASAYRGYAYAVFDDLELKPEDGNRIPAQMSFEVYASGTDEDVDIEEYSNEVLHPWKLNTLFPEDSRNTLEYFGEGFRSTVYNPTGSYAGPYATDETALGHFMDAFNTEYTPTNPINAKNVSRVVVRQAQFNAEYFYPRDDGIVLGDAESIMIHYNQLAPSGYGDVIVADGDTQAYVTRNEMLGPTWYRVADLYEMGITYVDSELSTPYALGNISYTGRVWGGREVYSAPDIMIKVTRSPSPPIDPCAEPDAVSLDYPGYCVVNGYLRRAGSWTYDNTTQYKVLSQFTVEDLSNPTVTRYPLNPTLKSGHVMYNNQDYWEAAYERAVALNLLPPGLVYGVDYPVTQNWGYKRTVTLNAVDPQPVTLASIIESICARVGAEALDTEDLEDILVYGYKLGRTMAARGAIEPLRSYGFFDVVESGAKLKFPTRGKTTIATLTDADLSAHDINEQRPPAVQSRRLQEKDLPRQIRVHYQSIERDLEPGEELSPERIDTRAETVQDIEIPVAMYAQQAAQKAEVVMRDAWTGRFTYEASCDVSQSKLEPADNLILPADNRAQRVRIIDVTDKLPNLRQLALMRDDDGQYTSYAVGSTINRVPTPIAFYGPADLVLLDIPALRAEDNDAGVYAAMQPSISASDFAGATIYKSIDGGISYTSTVTSTTAVPIGSVVIALDEAPSEIWDFGSELRVSLPTYVTLESRTEEDVLAGANTFAVGVDGRWEIAQFLNATEVVSGVWSLSGFLRGRRGTEAMIGTGVPEDTFVLLSTGGLVRVPLSVAEVHAQRYFKPVAVGRSQANTDAIAFTGHGVALTPFSPVHIEGTIDSDDAWHISWTRRDRLSIDYVVGEDTPMSESVEDYEVEILNGSTVVRTISVSDTEALYTADQQTIDFGELKDSISVRVYQISAAVGRGYPGEATL